MAPDPLLLSSALRLASATAAPLVRKLLVTEGPGAELIAQPVRVSSLLSFTGERRTLGERELRALAAELVDRAVRQKGPHEAPDAEVRAELVDGLTTALHSLGDLDMDDAQAVRLGPAALARRLTHPTRLSAAADGYYWPLLHDCCLHILNFFTQRSSYVPRTLTEQARQLARLITTVDRLAERTPAHRLADTAFEERYAAHIAARHGELTIYGLDLRQGREWRLDTAYISLDATEPGETDRRLPAEQVLSGRDQVLLRGGAGSGKTTLVQWLAVATADQRSGEHLTPLLGRVPFVLPLRRVVTDGDPPTPDRFLHAVRSSLAGAQPEGWATRVLHAGRALLLIDGIDEIPETHRDEVRRWIRELRADFPGNLWLVTARPSAVREDWLAADGFTELSLAAMSSEDVGLFVRRWHRAAGAPAELARRLTDAVRTQSALAALAVNPLMCGLLCALHRERDGFLPHGRKDLYEAALAMLLERRDTERRVRVGEDLRLSKETQILLLQKLAHWMLRNDRSELERADALRQLELALPAMAHVPADPGRVLRHLLERSGLLREPAADRIDFVHRTFQDHLAAKAAVEEGDFPLLLDNAHRDQWEDVLRMAVAHGRPAERERLLEGLIDVPEHRHDGGSDGVRRLLLAAACLEHATEVAPRLRERITRSIRSVVPPDSRSTARAVARCGPFVLGLLPGPAGLTDAEAENVVVCALRVGTEAALPLLARYCGHPAIDVRRRIAGAWDRFDTDRYAEEVIARLDPDGLYFSVHTTAHAEALRRLGGRPRVQLVGDDWEERLPATVWPGVTHVWFRDTPPLPYGRERLVWTHTFPDLREIVIPPRYQPADIDPPPGVTVRRTLRTDRRLIVTRPETAPRSAAETPPPPGTDGSGAR